ncbi:MAG: DUF4058 family protein [Planctomycetota bacterium]
MPVHDWTRVEAGIFHDFHHGWIEEIKRALNSGILPADYYALAEQHAAGFGPDVLTLESPPGNVRATPMTGSGLQLAPPKVRVTAEADLEFYRRKQNTITVRHVSGDRVVAIVEIVSPGNKGGRGAFRAFVEKAADLLEQRIHLLILDLHPPSVRDPQGIHGAIWAEISGVEYLAPTDKRLTLASYESGDTTRAYVEPIAVGDALPDMPLFLEPRAYVNVPLDRCYQSAFAGVPTRWRQVLESVF